MEQLQSLRVENAIISVYNKTNLLEFLEKLSQIIPDLQIFSTAGTLNLIHSNMNVLSFKNPVVNI